MNEDILKGRWMEIEGRIKEKWGRLIDDDLVEIEGIQERIEGLLQTKYGYSQERAQVEYRKFLENYKRDTR